MSDADLFDCPRHMALRLTPASCATSWRFAKGLPRDSLVTAAKCKGCPTGAGNAGEKAEVSREVDVLDQLCARCHRRATKMVYGRICVSCANRQYEYLKGKNARGNKPTGLPPLKAYGARMLSEVPKQVEIDLAVSGPEAWLSMMRDTDREAYIAFDGLAKRGNWM